MKVVEDVEEGILRTLSHEILDVVHYQDIDFHVIGQEVCQLVADSHGIHVLGLELVAGDIEHHEFGEFLLY